MQLVSTLKRPLAITAVMGSLVLPSNSRAQTEPPSEPPVEWTATAIDYSNVHYPWPVEYFDVELFGLDLRMAYMDVEPTGLPNGRTVIVFHGMNFFAAPYEPMIRALTEAGFRTIAIDRLGYGRSSKPDIHYNLHIPARNTKALLDHLGIERAAVVGHSICLLYTSPSPRDGLLSRMPSSA